MKPRHLVLVVNHPYSILERWRFKQMVIRLNLDVARARRNARIMRFLDLTRR